MLSLSASAANTNGVAEFRRDVRPILEQFCFDCHADGANKGNVAFDEVKFDHGFADSRELWWKALKNLRAGLMPPNKKPQPSREQKEKIIQWIKSSVFESNPADPDPGRITVRRLNRVEYHNTVRDLLGVDYDTQAEFPADDTGYGFDNIGDVLTLPPMLLEKYLIAAEAVVAQAVPTVPAVVAERVIPGRRFQSGDAKNTGNGPLPLSFYSAASVSNAFNASHAGRYQLALALTITDKFVDNTFDYNRCRLILRADGNELWRREYSWEGGRQLHYDFEQDWSAGNHLLEVELQPLTPDEKQTRSLSMQLNSLTVRGPMAKEFWVQPPNYRRFFPRDVPSDPGAKKLYARQLLRDFARRAFRRPVDDATVDHLVVLSEGVYEQPGKTFEQGVAQGMVAVLASSRFLFHEEAIDPASGESSHPFVDEFSLASRLSYFFWSSMPDEELFRLAGAGQLRTNLDAQVKRMLADRRSDALVKNFVGQWLQARDIENVVIDARAVLAREDKVDSEAERRRRRFFELNNRPADHLTPEEKDELATLRTTFIRVNRQPLRADLTGDVRRAMRQESERVFDYILREDRSLVELLDSDYTFLNERLAKHYGITNVVGDEMRRVTLAPDSKRGGILTQGTVLAVTSNPTRTSPVKRGAFILDNILGTPAPPPPPNIPPLEDATKHMTNHSPSLRETLAAHRENALCSSCHNRMDPPGLALENFNAMGMWREKELDQPITGAGQLITGEAFTNVTELKHILAANHAVDFYRTLTQKMLTYALGRGLEYYDVETVDEIVDQIAKAGGRPSALISGIVNSAAFQKMRSADRRSAVSQAADPREAPSRLAFGDTADRQFALRFPPLALHDILTPVKDDVNP